MFAQTLCVCVAAVHEEAGARARTRASVRRTRHAAGRPLHEGLHVGVPISEAVERAPPSQHSQVPPSPDRLAGSTLQVLRAASLADGAPSSGPSKLVLSVASRPKCPRCLAAGHALPGLCLARAVKAPPPKPRARSSGLQARSAHTQRAKGSDTGPRA